MVVGDGGVVWCGGEPVVLVVGGRRASGTLAPRVKIVKPMSVPRCHLTINRGPRRVLSRDANHKGKSRKQMRH